MKKKATILTIISMVFLAVIVCLLNRKPEEPPPAKPEIRMAADLVYLENTDHFTDEAIEHIFLGTINDEGKASGYHYDGIEDSPGRIVEDTRSEPDSFGVYTARVKVNGKGKAGNRGYSTFYPDVYTPQEVIDAVNEAYENRVLLSGSLYAGLSEKGIEIDMALDENDRIITAYPVKEDDRK